MKSESEKGDQDRDPVLCPKEVARLLKQHEQTVYRMRARGEGPPFIRLGRKVVYLRSSVLKWLAGQEQGGGQA